MNDIRDQLVSLVRTDWGGRPWYAALIHNGVSYATFFQQRLARGIRLGDGKNISTPDYAGRFRSRVLKVFFVVVTAIGLVRLLVHRPKVMIFSPDVMGSDSHDPRMSGAYDFVRKHRLYFGQVIHTTAGARSWRHFLRRRGPILYLEALDSIAEIMRRLHLTPEAFTLDVPNARSDLRECTRRASRAVITTKILSWTLKRVRSRQFWIIDDTRYWPQMVVAAQGAGVLSVLFQHGRFSRYESGLLYAGIPSEFCPLPSQYLVWNSYWREKLLSTNTVFQEHSEGIRVAGKTNTYTPSYRDRIQHSDVLRVLVIHEHTVDQSGLQKFIAELLSLGDVAVLYKLRADQSTEEQIGFLGSLTEHSHFSTVSTVPDVHLAVGSYSTLLYEMVQMGVPIGVLAISSRQAEDLIEDGLASSIDPYATNIREQLIQASDIDPIELRRRAQILATPTQLSDTLEELLV